MAFGFGFGMPRSFAALFSPASFFANGEQGWWYDPSNFSTLFQDSAGTTPVTAMEQPVGLQLDLSKGLVLGPELANGSWTTSAGATQSPTGTFNFVGAGSSARLDNVLVVGKTYLISFSASGTGSLNIHVGDPSAGSIDATITTTGNYTFRLPCDSTDIDFQFRAASSGGFVGSVTNITVKELPGNHRFQTTSANRPVVSARVNLFVGTATLATQSVTTRATTHTLTFTGAGSITLTGTAIGIYTAGTYSVTTTAGTLTATVLGTVTQADLRETNVGVGLPAYQAVVTSTNYDSTGFPVYIKPNGSNQFMQTNSINFTATDKMTVWQGVRKLSDAAGGFVVEYSQNSTLENGTFALFAPRASSTPYSWRSRGSANADADILSGYQAPITNVLTGIGDISGDQSTLRINGAQAGTSSADQGTGNFGNWPAYFYARAGTSIFFGGNDYGSIARGAASTAAQIANGEKYMAAKTGVTLLVETFDFITTDAGDQIVTDAGDSVISDTYFA
jgi:hypothetical protein